MKILIFLFAVITFMLMAGDPRREDFESKEFEVKKMINSRLNKKLIRKIQQNLPEPTISFQLSILKSGK